jgi:DNA-directed RNA polymerase specialized sigma24 family protein
LSGAALDLAFCEDSAARAVRGDADAAQRLTEHLWPFWVELVRSSRSMGSLARSEDHVHEVVVRLVGKFSRGTAPGLARYAPWRERHTDKTFGDWVRIVAKNQVRDYVREQMGAATAPAGEPSLKRLLNEFASSPALEELGERPPLTAAQTARQLLEFAARRLPQDQLRVLGLWLEGATFEEMAEGGERDPDDARRLLRAAVATLRREFSS